MAAPVPPLRLAPLRVVVQSWSWALGGFDTLLRLGWVPALLLTLLGTVLEPMMPRLSPDGTTIEVDPGAVLTTLVLAVVTILVNASVMTAWQRHLLLPGADPVRRAYLRLGRRELLYGLVVFFLSGLFAMGMSMAPGAYGAFASGQPLAAAVLLAGPVAALLIVARMVTLLPAVALDRPADVARSWLAVRGNTARVALVLVAVGIPAFGGEILLLQLGATVLQAGYGLAADLVVRFVSVLLGYVLFAPVVGATGLVYALLVEPSFRGALPRPAEHYGDGAR